MKKLFITIYLLGFCLAAIAQQDSLYYEQHDTTYYEWFHNHLSAGLFQSNRNYTLTFNQNFFPDKRNVTEIKYHDNVKAVTGISLDFDKLSVNIGFKSKSGDNTKNGNTSVKNFAVTVGRTRFFANIFYRQYKGFYDMNTANYDSSYTADKPYYQVPSLRNSTYKFKVTYFPNWKKFSIKSTVSAGFRQLKSNGSPVIQATIYHNTIDADTSFIPPALRSLYSDYDYINYLRTFAISCGGGGSYSLIIFRKFFINVTAIINAETQWRRYGFYDRSGFEAAYFKFSFEGRTGIGYTNDRFFVSLNAINDFTFLKNTTFEAESNYTTLTLTVSYRFKIKKNVITSYIKDNKIYRKL